MQVLGSLDRLGGLDGPVSVAIGVFDGVHLGHQAVVRAVMDAAQEEGGSGGVLTFEPHPMRVLRPEAAPRRLTCIRHKRRLLERLGVGWLVEHPFTEEFSQSAPEEFLGALEAAAGRLGTVVTGTDFCFGKDRAGDAGMIREWAEARGARAVAVPPVWVGDGRVSSTRVRAAVRAGDLDECKNLLGRPWSVLGRVGRGRQLGREIGFPTANVMTGAGELPPTGVYAVRVEGDDGVERDGVANLGVRPTVGAGDDPLLLEVHVLDFEGDLYDREIEVRFVGHLRAEMKFDGVDSLRGAIAADVARAREVLAAGA